MRIDRNARPTKLTNADIARQMKALQDHDDNLRHMERWARIWSVVYTLAALGLLAYGFYHF